MNFPLPTPGNEKRRAAWRFGEQLYQGPFSHSPAPYYLDLAEHQGLIIGQTERGIQRSLLRLAANAGLQGWKVVMFDAHGVPAHAMQFAAAMHAVGRPRTCVLPHAASSFRAYLAGALSLQALMSACGVGAYGHVDALYLGFSVGDRSEEPLAHLLLTGLVRYLAAWGQVHHRLLLLIKHPCPLFAAEQLAPLFAFCEQVGSSLFIAARSFADLGGSIRENASTLLLHRGSTARHVTDAFAQRGFRTHALLNKTLRHLPDDQCLAVHCGQLARVRVDPVVGDLPYSLQDIDNGTAHAWTGTSPGQTLRRRAIRICTQQQAHLRAALALLGFQEDL